MLEAPEACLLAEQFNKTIKGKTITEVVAGFTPHKFTWFSGGPEEYSKWLAGKTVGPSHSMGGMLVAGVEGMELIFAEGVSLRYLGPGSALPEKHQFLLGFDDDSCLVVSVRMYGGIICFPKGEYDGNLKEYYEAARDKPQVMSDDFTEDYFTGLFRSEDAGKKSAKAFLATGQAIPGLGNGVLQDILYNARINSKTKIQTLSDDQKHVLYRSIKDTLQDIYRHGGRNTENDITGTPGGYIPFLSKDTAGKECVRCGSIIMKESYMGGSVYYCPGCQKQDNKKIGYDA